jgi:hypothetical protein
VRPGCRSGRRRIIAPVAHAPAAARPIVLSPTATSQTCPLITVCNSRRNARSPVTWTRLVRVTHPFHPLSGKSLICVGEQYNRHGTRLLLRIDEESVRSVPRQWTDVVAPDPEVVLGGGRALVRVSDLVELSELVERLVRRTEKNLDYVSVIMPHM